MKHVITGLRLVIVTMVVCCAGYTVLIWGLANLVRPWAARGSLLTDDSGHVVGSALIAQNFAETRYFWPRPSAVDYNASATGGSNKSPANPELAERLKPLLAAHGAGPANPLPADLATASGSGVDPHITLEAALFQAPRVAQARGVEASLLVSWLERRASSPGSILGGVRIINVLETNLALDRGEVR